MALLDIKAPDTCLWDEVSMGEIMIRLDPGDTRIHTTRQFRVWEGGGSTMLRAVCAAALASAPPSSPPWWTT